MVGLSVVLESHKSGTTTSTPTSSSYINPKMTVLPLVIINKASMIIKPPPISSPPPLSSGGFLDACLLCRQKLLPGKDIYMYKGDRPFCSEECRWKHMLMDEKDDNNNNTSSLSRRKERVTNNCSLATTDTSATRSTHYHHRKATRSPQATGGFAR